MLSLSLSMLSLFAAAGLLSEIRDGEGIYIAVLSGLDRKEN